MISKLDSALIELESKEKALKNTLEQTKSEPQKAKEQLIQIDELMHSIKSLQKVPDEAKLKLIQDVLGRLDDDFDGQLKIDDVLKVCNKLWILCLIVIFNLRFFYLILCQKIIDIILKKI